MNLKARGQRQRVFKHWAESGRSLKEHYVKQIRELEQQLAAAQGTKTRSVDTDEPARARNVDGTYRGDDPSTPDVNEAWEGGEPPAKGKRGREKLICSRNRALSPSA